MSTNKEKVLVISASNNKDGNSATLCKWFLEGANTDTYEFEWVYLYDLHIDAFTNENRKALVEQDPKNKDIRDLITKIESVKKVVITTPIWNFSVPSKLKAMIDRTMASGRIFDTEKGKKVPGWKGKKFYLLFTMGAPWYGVVLDVLAISQLYFSLWYFGASRKIVKVVSNCGNGSRCVIGDRGRLRKKMMKKGGKIFR